MISRPVRCAVESSLNRKVIVTSAADDFSASFTEARDRFLAAAHSAGAKLHSLTLDAAGPRDETLTIDIAWLGNEAPQRALLHTSGLHGVEGFLGSAIQVGLLRSPPPSSADAALVLIHTINPFGMAWLRRVNENNVDLNRNFLPAGRPYRGAPEAYHRLNKLLNPPSPPAFDFFTLRALWHIARHGFAQMKQAVASGQYEYPQGLFFGGHQLEQGPKLLLAWLKQEFVGVRRVAAIDVHSGLGHYGEDTLLVSYPKESNRYATLHSCFEKKVSSYDTSGIAYPVAGGFLDALEREMPKIDWLCIGQEFGTYKPLRVLRALRDESRWHHYGDNRQLDHKSKMNLLEAFCPADLCWRQAVVRRGQQLVEKAMAELR